MAQKILAIWVGEDVDENDMHCQEMVKPLCEIVDHVILLSDSDMCLRLVQEAHREKLFVIASASHGQNLAPHINTVAQLEAIFILCDSSHDEALWTKSWSKIRGVYDSIQDISKALQQTIKQTIESTLPISFIDLPQNESKIDLDQLEPSFMYTKLIKEILLTTDHDDRARHRLVEYFEQMYTNTSNPPKDIQEFIRDYRADTAIWWYTRGSYIYNTLNQALRLLDTEVLLAMGLFLYDLHKQIEQLHRDQLHGYHGEVFEVYRGQALSTEDFQKLFSRHGGLISFNCFLSTSRDREVSTLYTITSGDSPDIRKVFFVVRIDPAIQTAPFAAVQTYSYFPDEDEILFSMNAVFRVGEIQHSTGFVQISLTLTAETDPCLLSLYTSIRQEIGSEDRLDCLTQLLLTLGQGAIAERFYLPASAHNENQVINVSYNRFHGMMKFLQGDFSQAARYFELNLTIHLNTRPDDHPLLASSYNNIAVVHKSMGDYTTALSGYNRALAMMQKTLPENHPSLASSYNNLANVYQDMGDYTTALSHYNRALELRRKTLPENHPDLASSYNNTAGVYQKVGDYTAALSQYNRALELRRKTLPENHPDLASSYKQHR